MKTTILFKIGTIEFAYPDAANAAIHEIVGTGSSRVKVTGHTCKKRIYEEQTMKDFGTNATLSLARAKRVASALYDSGLGRGDVEVLSKGSDEPTGYADIAADRRVVIETDA